MVKFCRNFVMFVFILLGKWEVELFIVNEDGDRGVEGWMIDEKV